MSGRKNYTFNINIKTASNTNALKDVSSQLNTISEDAKTAQDSVSSMGKNTGLDKVATDSETASKGIADIGISAGTSATGLQGLSTQAGNVQKNIQGINSGNLQGISGTAGHAGTSLLTLAGNAGKVETALNGINASNIDAITSKATTASDALDKLASKSGKINTSGSGGGSYGGSRGGSGITMGTALGVAGVAGVGSEVLGTASKKEVNKVSVGRWGGDTSKIYGQIDQATNNATVSMQDVIPAMNAVKAATGSTGAEMGNQAQNISDFGSYVQALTGSSTLAGTAMMDLSKGAKGAFASLDQYGITEASLKATGEWSGPEDSFEHYMNAVKAVVGDTSGYMNTYQGQMAKLGKTFSRSGGQLGAELLPGLKGLVGGFVDLDNATGGNISKGLLIGTGVISGFQTAADTINGLSSSYKDLKKNVKDAYDWMKKKIGKGEEKPTDDSGGDSCSTDTGNSKKKTKKKQGIDTEDTCGVPDTNNSKNKSKNKGKGGNNSNTCGLGGSTSSGGSTGGIISNSCGVASNCPLDGSTNGTTVSGSSNSKKTEGDSSKGTGKVSKDAQRAGSEIDKATSKTGRFGSALSKLGTIGAVAGIAGAFSGLGGKLTGVLGKLKNPFGKEGSKMGSELAGNSGKGVVGGVEKSGLGSGIGKAVEKGGTGIMGKIGAKLGSKLAIGATASLIPGVGEIVDAFLLITTVLDVLGIDWWTPLAGGLSWIAGLVTGSVMGAFTALVGIGQQVWTAIGSGVSGLISILTMIGSVIWGSLVNGFNTLRMVGIMVWSMISGAVMGVVTRLMSLGAFIWSLPGKFMAALGRVPGIIASALGQGIGRITSFVSQGAGKLASGARTMVNNFKNGITGIANAVKDELDKAWNWIKSIGQQMIDTAKNIGSQIADAFSHTGLGRGSPGIIYKETVDEFDITKRAIDKAGSPLANTAQSAGEQVVNAYINSKNTTKGRVSVPTPTLDKVNSAGGNYANKMVRNSNSVSSPIYNTFNIQGTIKDDTTNLKDWANKLSRYMVLENTRDGRTAGTIYQGG